MTTDDADCQKQLEILYARRTTLDKVIKLLEEYDRYPRAVRPSIAQLNRATQQDYRARSF
jgi:hypothetical protein